ncbi:hypothetical protein [Bradyrhizobium sp. Ce-3]|nr:hypothetical protein [Bradyrhizobium sp. Ce-3]
MPDLSPRSELEAIHHERANCFSISSYDSALQLGEAHVDAAVEVEAKGK